MRIAVYYRAVLLLCLLTTAGIAPGQVVPEAAGVPIDFDRDIRPVLADRCFHCHGPDAVTRKAKLRLDVEHEAKRSVIQPGNADASALISRISSADPDKQMPPPDSQKPALTPEETARFRAWILQGAVWPKHWAFAPVQKPEPPTVSNASWPRNDVDRFVLARLEAEGLAPSAEAPRETLIRRLSFDLTGLPPTLAEIDAFVADTAPDAYERLVDRLMASPHYGERMALEWLDASRYADTNGFQNDFQRYMWPWRDWVIAALNDNMHFDEFVVEQMAGDLLPNATQAQRVATGFNRNNRSNTEGGSIEAEWHVEALVDRVETTSAVFLGLTMGCARCHDHKYDPVSQREFYQFMAFFNTTNDKGFYEETRGNAGPVVQLPTPDNETELKRFDADIARAEQRVEELKALPTPGQSEFVQGFYNLAKPLLAKVRDRKLADLRAERDKYMKEKVPSVMVMEEAETPRETYRLVRGQYDQPDTSELLQPAVPSFLPPLPAGTRNNRLGLAKWLVDPANPLTARVTVNRIWAQFFGQGLVRTPDNFGLQSDPPSHPELLDWLASNFVAGGWDVKAFQKMIVCSATYRQRSELNDTLLVRDLDNVLLARGPRYRLSAELIRDNALAVSGLLSPKIGGPSVKPYQPDGLWAELAGGAGEGPYVQSKGEDLYRRGLYTYRKRTVSHPTVSTFDAPSWEICRVYRARTNTPLQALALLNDTTYVEASRHLAQRILAEAPGNADDRVRTGFRLVTGRWPSDAEKAILSSGVQDYLADFGNDPGAAEAFIAHGDSPAAETADRVQLAAYTAMASVLLNMDSAITKE